jgi:hypothetical protein
MDSAAVESVSMPTLMESFEELVARWVLDDLRPEDVPAVAIDALAQGCEVPEVAVLAGLRRPSRLDVEDELSPLLRRLRVVRPDQRRAMKTVVDACAQRMVDGGMSPSAGARALWRWAMEFHRDDLIFEQLAIFVGLASEWDDDEGHRAVYEAEMLEEAQALLDAGGLRLE